MWAILACVFFVSWILISNYLDRRAEARFISWIKKKNESSISVTVKNHGGTVVGTIMVGDVCYFQAHRPYKSQDDLEAVARKVRKSLRELKASRPELGPKVDLELEGL